MSKRSAGAGARKGRIKQLRRPEPAITVGSEKPRNIGVVNACPSQWWQEQVKAQRTKFPPPADHTPMRLCESDERRCGKFHPSYYGQSRDEPGEKRFRRDDQDDRWFCDDCRLARHECWLEDLREEGIIDDARAQAIARHRAERGEDAAAEHIYFGGGMHVGQCELLTEDPRVLQAQIDRFLAGKDTSLIEVDFTEANVQIDVQNFTGNADSSPSPALNFRSDL